MDDLDRYLNLVCWAMGGTLAEQQVVRDELRAHIAEEARELEMQGVTRTDAWASALRDLGDAEALGRSMRASRGTAPLKRPLVQPAGALVLERRSQLHVPRLGLLLAATASTVTAAAVALAYTWPG
jgi:hypothetical protein